MRGICPACGGHMQLECKGGQGTCCPDCTVHRGSDYVDGHDEFLCDCGCEFDIRYTDKGDAYTVWSGFDFTRYPDANGMHLCHGDIPLAIRRAAYKACGVTEYTAGLMVLSDAWRDHSPGSLVVLSAGERWVQD